MSARKPFRVSQSWIEWAHGPAAEDAQRLACELVALEPVSPRAEYVLIPPDRSDLVRELVSVAGLYVPHDGSIEWHRAAYASSLIRRGGKWLRGGVQ